MAQIENDRLAAVIAFRATGRTDAKGQNEASALPCRIAHWIDAQVARQRCPILQPSHQSLSCEQAFGGDISTLQKRGHFYFTLTHDKKRSNVPSNCQKWRMMPGLARSNPARPKISLTQQPVIPLIEIAAEYSQLSQGKERFYLMYALYRELMHFEILQSGPPPNDPIRPLITKFAALYYLLDVSGLPHAVHFYKQALALNPVQSKTRYFSANNLGYSLNRLGNYAEAEPLSRNAIEVDPHQHNAYKNLGVA